VHAANNLPDPSPERASVAILAFCRTFVPVDVEEEDIAHFCNNLVTDAVRKIFACAYG
jgi:hypothetical protein